MKGRIKRPEDVKKMILPRVGIIKTGYKDEKGYPKSVDYFIPSGKYEMHFMNACGAKPETIQVVFLDDDPANVCFERYEYRDNEGKLYARGDGELFEVWNGERYQEYNIADHPNIMNGVAEKCPNKKGWEVILTLRFILPKVRGIVGYWEFSTKGEASSIPQIRGTFDMMIENRGFVKGIIFDLSVQFAKSQKPGSKSRYPVVSLIPNQSDENIEIVKGGLLNIDELKLIE